MRVEVYDWNNVTLAVNRREYATILAALMQMRRNATSYANSAVRAADQKAYMEQGAWADELVRTMQANPQS